MTFILTGQQIVNRAAAMSCAGCHMPVAFGLLNANSIGPGLSWPDALSFVHVDTPPAVSIAGQPGFNPSHFGGNSQGFNISPALLNVFLPARRTTLANLHNLDVCDCVRKAPSVPPKSASSIRHREIVARSQERTRADLAAAAREFNARQTVTAADVRQHLAQQRSIIAKAEAARNAELQTAGIEFVEPPARPQPEILAKQELPREKLATLKRQRVDQLVNAEPPRKSITGSFRPH
jgi:hypothetical protein